MSKISEFNNLQAPSESAVLPIVDNTETRKVSVANLRKALFVPATATTFGAVKVGDNLSIDANGVLNAASPAVHADWTAATGPGVILNKPTLSAVAISNAYNDLTGRPNIPPAQVQADWEQTDDQQRNYIKNKPVLSLSQLVNGDKTASLGTNGTLTLPNGGKLDFNDPYNRYKGVSYGVQLGSPDDQNYVNVDNTHVTIQTNSDSLNGNTQHNWIFGTDSKLTFPNNATFDGQTLTDSVTVTNYTLKIANGSATGSQFAIGTGNTVFGIANDALNHSADGYVPYTVTAQGINLIVPESGIWNYGTNGVLTLPNGQLDYNAPYSRFKDATNTGVQMGSPDDQNYVNVDNVAVTIQVNSDGVTGPHNLPQLNWVFDTDGNLTLPPGGTVKSNGLGITVYAETAPTSSIGSSGDMPGMIFATSLFTYICYGTYDGVSNIWAKTATVGSDW